MRVSPPSIAMVYLALVTTGCFNPTPPAQDGTTSRGEPQESSDGVVTTSTMPGTGHGSADGTGTGLSTSTSTSTGPGTDTSLDDLPGDTGLPDVGVPCREGMGGEQAEANSAIWIANSSEGTVSKIDTATMIELGRYIVRPDSSGSPSRTSVSLSGNLGVANRLGGVAKIYGDTADCQESNGVPGIQTSSGGADVLAWGTEECIAWYTPLVYSSNRPMAWTRGEWDSVECGRVEEKLWTAGANGSGTTQVLMIDGETGVVEQTIDVPEITSSIGLYGGAVDGEGNFWGIETAGVRLVRVDRDDFSYQVWDGPGTSYGLTVDSAGRPWFCAGGGADRFDPVTETWESLPSPGGNQWGGCMTDGAGTLWHCRQSDATLVGIDTETLTVMEQIPLPAYAHGISVDFNGSVWAVGFVSTDAYRVDPVAGTVDTFSGLNAAYTYSDMTGFGLSIAGTAGP